MNRRQFLGAALLWTCAALRRRPHLLPEGSHPPDFALPNAEGRSVSFTPFLGHSRVVLLFVPKARGAQGRAYLKEVEREKAQFSDRALVVLAIAAPGALADAPSTPPVTVLHDTREKAAVVYEAVSDALTFYLVGKDGHIALARRGVPTNAELFGAVDAMPMRRREMRERRR